jgi:hypothetical protein
LQILANETADRKRWAVVDSDEGLHPIELYHVIENHKPSCTLQYMSDSIALQPVAVPDVICCNHHLPGSPHTVRVVPSSPCATLSLISATATLWTAGVTGVIEIASKDIYGNFLETWDDKWCVYMTSVSPAAQVDFSSERLWGGNVIIGC